MASNGIAKPPGEDNDALRRHKWLAVLINELSRKINNYEVPSDTLDELNIPRQIADIAVGMCWALSPDEYEDIRVSTMQALENGHDDSHEQHKYIAEALPSWIDEFKAGPGRREHPSQRPHFADTQESPLSRPQSPDFKWPLTRKERMEELDQVYLLYADTPQAPNIIAAKDYHSKFPADQVVPETIVVFMDGRQIDESEISMHKGQPWCEGSVDDFMTGGPGQLSVANSPLSLPCKFHR